MRESISVPDELGDVSANAEENKLAEDDVLAVGNVIITFSRQTIFRQVSYVREFAKKRC